MIPDLYGNAYPLKYKINNFSYSDSRNLWKSGDIIDQNESNKNMWNEISISMLDANSSDFKV